MTRAAAPVKNAVGFQSPPTPMSNSRLPAEMQIHRMGGHLPMAPHAGTGAAGRRRRSQPAVGDARARLEIGWPGHGGLVRMPQAPMGRRPQARAWKASRQASRLVAMPAANGSRALTMRSVAERAGVSIGTVSNVLNRPEIVAEETRERVQAAMDALGYVRNASASQLRSGRVAAIGLVMFE